MSGLVLGRPGPLLLEPSYFILCDESAVPAQDGVGRDDARDLGQELSAERLSLDREPSPLLVGESDSAAAELFAKEPVLLDEVVDDGLLLAVDPSREEEQEEGERGRQGGHEGRVPEGSSSVPEVQ